MTILLVALVPAVLVWAVGNATRSFGWLVTSATVAAGVGIVSGNPAYAMIDMFFVACAFVITAKTVRFKRPTDKNADLRARPQNGSQQVANAPRTTAGQEVEDARVVHAVRTSSQPSTNTASGNTSHMQPSLPPADLAPARWVSLDPEKEAREESRKAKWRDFRDMVLGAALVVCLIAAGTSWFLG